MQPRSRFELVLLLSLLVASPLFGQAKQTRVVRRPAADATQKSQSDDSSGAVYVLDGMPMLMEVHHDTIVGTNKPVDVYLLVIEMQVMNSDGNLEPIGLQIHNFFTKWPRDAVNDFNPHNALDCKKWFKLVNQAMANRDPKSKTWPYLELLTNVGARVLQTNEDGAVWYSDDIQCWGSSDRFAPF